MAAKKKADNQFAKIATARVNRALKAIRAVGTIPAESTADQRKTVVEALQKALDGTTATLAERVEAFKL
jgi:hypothetical protein